ncbi:hypothetical protein ABZ896_35450 [Streptomyces sp. NPDC047072]|uniref:hypothetical protein n=1 Tax=Streptomyces sp. NPDC047072 TaxID=3154809 RepID=UPI00340BE31F
MTGDSDRRGSRRAGGRGPRDRADVWLGDLALALEAIDCTEEDRLRIVSMLGLRPRSEAAPGRDASPRRSPAAGRDAPSRPPRTTVLRLDPAPVAEPAPSTASSTAPAPPVADVLAEAVPVPDRPRPAVPDAPRDADGPSAPGAPADRSGRAAPGPDTGAHGEPEPLPPDAVPVPPSHRPAPVESTRTWQHTWAHAPLPRPEPDRMRGQPPYTPLLARSSTVALLEAALSDTARDGDVDIERVVESLARGLPLAFLPRRARRTLRHGVQILVDHGPAMEPFARDQTELCARVRALVGKDKTRELHFAYSPLRGAGTGPAWTWRAYTPPSRGGAVLLLSDCGTIGPPGDPARGTPQEWQRFADAVRRAGARPLALLPVPPGRVPGWLPAVMPALSWDRGTTVGRVAAQVGAWRERCGAPLRPSPTEGGPS